MSAVRKLDVIVANHLAADPVTQAVWKRDRRVVYPSRAAKVPVTPEHDSANAAAAPAEAA